MLDEANSSAEFVCLKDSQLVYDLWKHGQDKGFVKAFNIEKEEELTMEVEW